MSRPGLREHQIRALKYACVNEYAIVALDPRLGKSRVAIEVREKYKIKCIVVCPAYLIDNWKVEIHKWVDNPRILPIYSGADIPISVKRFDYILVSYSLAQKCEHIFEQSDMVVLDEAPAIKSMDSLRAQFIHKSVYENSMKRVLLLTGTPIKNRVKEFYSLLALTFYNPSVPQSRFLDLYPDEITFAERFSHHETYPVRIGDSGKQIMVTRWFGLRRVKELRRWLKGRYIRIRDSDVLDMPPVSIKPVLMSDHADPKLLKSFNAFFGRDEGYDPERKRKDKVSSVLPEHKKVAAIKKVPFTIKYAENLLEEVDCILIYSDHIESCEAIAKHFGVTPITGKMVAQKRSFYSKRFQAGEGRVLCATIGALKEGEDLCRASHTVFNDLCWVPGDLKQVVNRMRMVGKKNPCTAHRIFGSPQDATIAEHLDEKMAVIEAVT